MATFVLVHGAFRSPAELAPVIPELEALGHRAIAVDLPCTDPAATLDDYARTVVEAMAGITGPVVVVGHSAGGATISRHDAVGLTLSTRVANRLSPFPVPVSGSPLSHSQAGRCRSTPIARSLRSS